MKQYIKYLISDTGRGGMESEGDDGEKKEGKCYLRPFF